MISSGTAKKLNFIVLLAAIVLTVVMCPREKQLYFDEPFQIMCSHGITLGNVDKFTNMGTFTSADLAKENTFHNVFMFGADSLHYVLLHYMNLFFGNHLNVAVCFSLFWGILVLISFYALCRFILGDSIYVAVAIALFFTDILFLNQTYNIRHYIMSLFVTNMCGIYFFKYYLRERIFRNLLLLGIWCALGILSHYFAIYIIMVFPVAILMQQKASFFTKKNILALAIPVIFLLVYFQFHWNPFQSNDYYQHYIKKNRVVVDHSISISQSLSLFLKSVAVNFQVYYPLFKDQAIVRICAFFLVIAAYIFGLWKLVPDKEDRKKYHLLFALGFLSSLFIMVMAYKSRNSMLFSYRYFLFSIPYCVLFMTLFYKQLCNSGQLNMIARVAIIAMFVAPGVYKFAATHSRHYDNGLEDNQLVTVHEIQKKGLHKMDVPRAEDAVFINSLLPNGYEMTYTLKTQSDTATLYDNNGLVVEKFRYLDNGLVVMF